MKYKEHTLEEKISIVKAVKEGVPMRQLASQHKLMMKYIIEWKRRYELYGETGLVNRCKFHDYSKEFREEIIDQVLKNHLSLPQVAVCYNVSEPTIRRWIKRCNSTHIKLVKSDKMKKHELYNKGQNDSFVNSEAFSQMVKEINALKLENALLKKVRALVLKRSNPPELNGLKQSKN